VSSLIFYTSVIIFPVSHIFFINIALTGCNFAIIIASRSSDRFDLKEEQIDLFKALGGRIKTEIKNDKR